MQELIRFRCRQLLWLLLTILVALPGRGQEFRPYSNQRSTHAALMGVGGTLGVVSVMLDRRVSPFTDEDLSVLSLDNVWGIDRYSTRHFDTQIASLTDGLVLATFATPFVVLANRAGRNNSGQIGLIALEGALINSGLINLTKVLVRRPRPYNFNPNAPIEYKINRKARYSFFSGHAATAAYFSFATAKMYNDLYPDSRLGPWVWGSAVLLPAVTGFGRMRAGRHYLTDVLVGYAVGATIGILVPALHKN